MKRKLLKCRNGKNGSQYRVTLPVAFVEILGFKHGDSVDMCLRHNEIVIKRSAEDEESQ